MSKSTQTMYFIVKIIAENFSHKALQLTSMNEMSTTKDCDDMYCEDEHGGKCFVRVGGKPGAVYHGVAGHFSMLFLNFSDEENRSCRSLDEAERLARKNHNDWLANAFDWWVAPVDVRSERNPTA